MRTILLSVVMLFSCYFYAQENTWEIYKEIDGVIIEKTSIECHDNEIMTFKITNTNNYKVIISWYEETWINDVCKQDGMSQEHYKSLTLSADSSVEGDCTFKESFYIGSKILRGNKELILTDFDLNNIIVKKVK